MKIKDLIGYRLVQIDNDKIIVKKDDKLYVLEIKEDYGGCCGYNDVETHLLIEENEIEKNPIITNIEYEDTEKEQYKYFDGNSVRITFYGNNKQLANIESLSSSGSGWGYGACVTIECKDLNIDEIITEW